MKCLIYISIVMLAMQIGAVSINADDGWSYNDGVLTVTQNTFDYKKGDERPWEKYAKEAERLVIKEGITYVGDWSFWGFSKLSEIEMPSTLDEIGERAFYNCSGLEYINIPEGVKSVGDGAFNSCKNAVRISLPDTLVSIGESAFMNIPQIPVITIPKSAESIGRWAFFGCTSLEQIYFEGGVPENIGDFMIADIHEHYKVFCAYEYMDEWAEYDRIDPEKMYIYYPEERIPVYLNNREIVFDSNAMILNGRTLVPMRAVFEAIGAAVTWNGDTETAKADRDGDVITVTIDSDTMRKNNEIISLDVPAQLIGNRTYVPVRAVTEAYGARVKWDEKERAVYIEIG